MRLTYRKGVLHASSSDPEDLPTSPTRRRPTHEPGYQAAESAASRSSSESGFVMKESWMGCRGEAGTSSQTHHSHHSRPNLPQYLPRLPGRPTTNGHRRDGSKDFLPAFLLLEAAEGNKERVVRDLVRRMVPLPSGQVEPIVNFQDQTGRTPLSYACGVGNIFIIEELSKLRRLDPNLADNDGNSPLHYASQAGHSEAVDLMFSRFEGTVDLNPRNSTGLTPLMKAALQGRTRCAKSLISAGASAHLRDYSRGLTAIEWARLCGRHICAEVIVRASKENYKHPGSPTIPVLNTQPQSRPLPNSQSAMELKRMNSEDSALYRLHNARNAVSGATWLKNKIKRALGGTGTGPAPLTTLKNARPSAYALLSNIGDATLCAGSLLLPSIKPLIDQQQGHRPHKITIPTLQVTMMDRR